MSTPLATCADRARDQLVELANAQFESAAYRKLLSVRFTRPGARLFEIQRAYFVQNRRDCWGYVQGGAPLDVKRLIWAHEQEELIGDPERGIPDHITLAAQEAAVVGADARELADTPPTDVAQTCFHAWIHLAKDRPWLEALAASAILEMVVSDEIVRGGGIVRRVSQRMAQDLGIPLEEQPTNATHVVADLEHANLLLDVARRHVLTDQDVDAVMRGARASLSVERVFRAHLADLIANPGDYVPEGGRL